MPTSPATGDGRRPAAHLAHPRGTRPPATTVVGAGGAGQGVRRRPRRPRHRPGDPQRRGRRADRPNGAGKTTLVNMISGLVPPSSGSATVLGVTVGRTPVHKRGGGGREPHLPALQAVQPALGAGERAGRRRTSSAGRPSCAGCSGCPRPAATSGRRSRTPPGACAASGWPTRPATRASALSYGDQRRLEIARALASDPSLLILDEPAAGMNHVEAGEAVGADQVAGRGRPDDPVHRAQRRHGPGDLHPGGGARTSGRSSPAARPTEIAADPAVIEAYLGTEDDEPVTGSIAEGTLDDPTGGPAADAPAGAVTQRGPGRGRHAGATGHDLEECDMSDPILSRGRTCGSATGGSRPSAASRSRPSRARW